MRVCRRGHTLWDDCVVFFCLPVRLPFTYTYAKNRERVRRQSGLKTFFSSRFKSWTFLLLNASFFYSFWNIFFENEKSFANFHMKFCYLCALFFEYLDFFLPTTPTWFWNFFKHGTAQLEAIWVGKCLFVCCAIASVEEWSIGLLFCEINKLLNTVQIRYRKFGFPN